MNSRSTLHTFALWNLLEYRALRIFAAIVNFLPLNASMWLAHRFGDALYFLMPKRKKTTLANLDIAFGKTLNAEEKQKIAKESFRNLTASLVEFLRIPSMRNEAEKYFEIEGTQYLDTAFQQNKGVIFAVSHLGSWEYLSFLFFLRKYPCSAIVRPAKNPYIYKWIQNLREQAGIQPIDRQNSIKEILRVLKSNGLVAILIDQWAGHDGIWVDFFGKPTSTTSIPARLAHKTGAAIIPGYCARITQGRYKIILLPEVPLTSGENYEMDTTAKLNSLFENEIRKYPSQWSWTHRRWKNLKRHLRNQDMTKEDWKD